jgi:hypothetical protein
MLVLTAGGQRIQTLQWGAGVLGALVTSREMIVADRGHIARRISLCGHSCSQDLPLCQILKISSIELVQLMSLENILRRPKNMINDLGAA